MPFVLVQYRKNQDGIYRLGKFVLLAFVWGRSFYGVIAKRKRWVKRCAVAISVFLAVTFFSGEPSFLKNLVSYGSFVVDEITPLIAAEGLLLSHQLESNKEPPLRRKLQW